MRPMRGQKMLTLFVPCSFSGSLCQWRQQGVQTLVSDTSRRFAGKIAETEVLAEERRSADLKLEPLSACAGAGAFGD